MKRAAAFVTLVGLAATLTAGGTRAEETPAAPAPLRVAVFVDEGVGRGGVEKLIELLSRQPDLKVDRIDAAGVREGKLSGYNVVLHPGGTGGGQGKALGADGREKVREFVRGGGGYLGICAGAYLATCDYEWSLHILDAKVIDRAHWARGNGDVRVTFSPEGKAILGVASEERTIAYFQGPLLAPADNPEIPNYEPLGIYATEIAKKGAPTGVMVGTTAVAAGRFGNGRVLCFSPHPEKTPGEEGAVFRALRWAANRAEAGTAGK